MIVRMSKVEIAGPKNLFLQVLTAIRELEVVHIDPDCRSSPDVNCSEIVCALVPDEEIAAEIETLEVLAAKIDELTNYLPQDESGGILLKVEDIIDSVRLEVETHLASSREWIRDRDRLQEEQGELDRQAVLIEALEGMLGNAANPELLEFIGVTLKKREVVAHLQTIVDRLTNGSFGMFVTTARDATPVVLLVVPRTMAEKVKELLRDESIPELVFPQTASQLGLAERIGSIRKRRNEISAELAETEKKLRLFARHWLAMYQDVRVWIERRRNLLGASAYLFETGRCFFLYGWMPTSAVTLLRDRFTTSFNGRVLLEEKPIQRKEFDDVPVLLRNSRYFEPFELFARLLPLPSYTSFDPTIFIGIFFPVFFGLILGDAGYGLLLFFIAFFCGRAFRNRPLIKSLTSILLVCSIYTVMFGLIFGEFLGELGHLWFGLHPIWMSRHEAVIPMLLFSISVGVCHVLLGLLLGVLTALRKGVVGEALFKFANILVVLSLVSFFIIQQFNVPSGVDKALAVAVALMFLMAIIGGGFLAPLELMKSIGNIISYARIMAIGLASVLLATVANVLGGMTGDVLTGILVATLFHAVNIVLGVFAPTIQSLRLHFVEFFSKFMEHGGRAYRPFR